MKILISTGIYPPKIGGPSQYAKNLESVFRNQGHTVNIGTFSFEDFLPTGLRHFVFFLKIIPQVLASDVIYVLDTFSVGLPTVFACKIFGKKSIIRTGGDFLWEQYVERTDKKVLFRNFYKDEKNNFSLKEKIIFNFTRWTLHNTDRIIFSTEWQRDIFIDAYGLLKDRTFIVENYYGPKESDLEPESLDFMASTRSLKWKNLDVLKRIFMEIKQKNANTSLFTDNLAFPDFMDKMKRCYAVIQISLGDISPNMILDAIRQNRPFICTKEVGILPRIKGIGIFVNPLDENEIEVAILTLLDKNEYEKARDKVRQFSFIHTWEDIGTELLSVYKTIK